MSDRSRARDAVRRWRDCFDDLEASIVKEIKAEREATEKRIKGHRRWCGEKNSQSKLTDVFVRNIRRRHAAPTPITMDELGRFYGVSRRTIQSILSRETWKHVE